MEKITDDVAFRLAELGPAIRELREALGISTSDLVAPGGMSRYALLCLERGTRLPTAMSLMTTLGRIGSVLRERREAGKIDVTDSELPAPVVALIEDGSVLHSETIRAVASRLRQQSVAARRRRRA